MLASQMYSPTLREVPADAEVVSHQLMLRAGFIRRIGAGIYTYLPLAWRTLRKIEAIVRAEMDAVGGQEILMPIVQPAEIWQETGRWNVYGEEMFRLTDRHQRHFCLAPTHEELVTTLVKADVTSYKQVPLTLYQIQNKYRDEVRPRFGLMRSREFIMKDAYSFHTDTESLAKTYRDMYDAYSRIFTRCGLYFRPVEADSGAIGGSGSHEFMVLAQSGEAAVVHCSQCDYAANLEVAIPTAAPVNPTEPAGELEEVATPGMNTIQALVDGLQIPVAQTIKAVAYAAGETVVLVMVPGDAEVNEVHVAGLFGEVELPPASEEALHALGFAPGYMSPVGIAPSDKLVVLVDPTVMNMNDAVCGANRKDVHYRHVSPQRDFKNVRVESVRLLHETDGCPQCGGKISIDRGIEVGQVFKLGTKYSEALGATVLDADGKSVPLIMGCYGVGVSRTMAASIEQNHDDDGIIWPAAIAPYEVVVVPANAKDEVQFTAARELYDDLSAAGVETVLDDRRERAGIKFKDADLIGYPLRVTVGKHFAEDGQVELKVRKTGVVETLPPTAVVERVRELLQEL